MTIATRNRAFALAIAMALFAINAQAEAVLADDDWKVLDSADYAFEKKEFGEALRLADKARSIHVAKYEKAKAILSKSVMPSEVKKAGDDLIDVYKALEKRSDTTALAVLDGIYLTRDPFFFGNSLSRLLAWLIERREYPEADILTGKVYEAEGEFSVAIGFFKKAWDKRSDLDIPDDRYTIAYHLADIAEQQEEFGSQEENLLLVLLDDEVYGAPGKESTTLQAMVRSIKADPTMTKFFMLYRHDRLVALKAYQDLARCYERDGRIDRAYPVAVLATCSSMTALAKTLQEDDFQYMYSTFEDLVRQSASRRKVVQWALDNNIWESFLLLSSIMWKSGDYEQATGLWNCLASYCPDATVARKASGELVVRKR